VPSWGAARRYGHPYWLVGQFPVSGVYQDLFIEIQNPSPQTEPKMQHDERAVIVVCIYFLMWLAYEYWICACLPRV
jgi:hypothetical protein